MPSSKFIAIKERAIEAFIIPKPFPKDTNWYREANQVYIQAMKPYRWDLLPPRVEQGKTFSVSKRIDYQELPGAKIDSKTLFSKVKSVVSLIRSDVRSYFRRRRAIKLLNQ